MFGKNKKNKSESSFSIMLAEEILRAELEKLYGSGIKLFQRDIVSMRPSLIRSGNGTMSRLESQSLADQCMKDSISERYVDINVIAGPFERLYPENPPNDRRRKLRRVEAACRLFTITTGAVHWQVHFLSFIVKDEEGRGVATELRCYESGTINCREMVKDAENPCLDMVESQTGANYPQIHHKLHGV